MYQNNSIENANQEPIIRVHIGAKMQKKKNNPPIMQNCKILERKKTHVFLSLHSTNTYNFVLNNIYNFCGRKCGEKLYFGHCSRHTQNSPNQSIT
jgi:hypothetical protein